MLINFWVSASIRLVGILLPGKQPASPDFLQVFPWAIRTGSAINTGFPFLSTLAEKSPMRSSAVGIVKCRSLPGLLEGHISWEKKKKSFSLLVLNTFGMKIGPPMF